LEQFFTLKFWTHMWASKNCNYLPTCIYLSLLGYIPIVNRYLGF
jgi:hypothetical protein